MSFWKNKHLVIAIILVLVLFILMVIGASGQTATDALTPVQEWLYTSSAKVGTFFSGIFGSAESGSKISALERQVSELETQLQSYDQIVAENERYKKLLNVVKAYDDYDTITASVIARSPDDWMTEFTIAAGTADGLKKGMIVVHEGGLLGRVVSVTQHYAKITTLLNTQGGIPALVERTRDVCVVKAENSGEEGNLSLEYTENSVSVVPGDTLITSGIGGVYPKGLTIGTVTSVGSGSNAEVTLQSSIDFDHLEEVVVLLATFEEVES